MEVEEHDDDACQNGYIADMTEAALNLSFQTRRRTLTEYEQQHCEQLHRFLAAHHKLNRLAIEDTIRDMESREGKNE